MSERKKQEAHVPLTDADILPDIPDADTVRRRLAVVLTEADRTAEEAT